MSIMQLLLPAFVASLILTGIHAYLGVHVVERGVIFVDLSLAQIAALGTTVAYLMGNDLHTGVSYFYSLGFTFLGAALFAVTGLVLACGSTIGGRPVVNPALATEPSPASSPPMRTPPRTIPPSGFPQELDPDAKDSVYIEAESGKTHCKITRADVQCESQFAHSPLIGAQRANNVYVSADGAMRWLVGNLAVIPAVKVDDRIYVTLGWTIVATTEDTLFTNDRTGHGMFVSIDEVSTY